MCYYWRLLTYYCKRTCELYRIFFIKTGSRVSFTFQTIYILSEEFVVNYFQTHENTIEYL